MRRQRNPPEEARPGWQEPAGGEAQFFEASYAAAYSSMSRLLKDALPDHQVDDCELRVFACCLAAVATTAKTGSGSPREVVAANQRFLQPKLEGSHDFEDRFTFYETLLVDMCLGSLTAAECLWTEPTYYITGNDSFAGHVVGTLGIYDVLEDALAPSPDRDSTYSPRT